MTRKISSEPRAPQVKNLLGKIAKASGSLNKTVDEATKYIEAIESSLEEAGVGVTVWGGEISRKVTSYCRLDQSGGCYEEVPATRISNLGYVNTGNEQGIAVKSFYIVDPSGAAGYEFKEEEITLFKSMNREMRILSVPHIPDLLNAICKNIEEKTEKTAEANTQLKGMGILSNK